MTDDVRGLLTVAGDVRDEAVVLTIRGVLDSRSYRAVRDEVVKAALEEPRAVIVDVTELTVPAESAWSVFTSARWHVDRWPEVPISLVCGHHVGRAALARNGITRYVPVHADMDAALRAAGSVGERRRRRARAELPADAGSLRESRDLVDRWLSAWTHDDMIAVAKVVVTALVENVLAHTDSAPAVRLESDGTKVTVAVEDASRAPAEFREHPGDGPLTGLQIVAALCRAWGNAPTPAGKTVWAVIGPENRL